MICFVDTGQNINEYMLQITSGTCKNSLYSAGFSQLSDTPPLPLIERYYACVLSRFDSAFQALGLALGNTQLAIAVLAFAAFWVLSMFLRLFFHYTDGVFAAPEEPEEDEYGYNKAPESPGGGISESEMRIFVAENGKDAEQQVQTLLTVLLEESKRLQRQHVNINTAVEPIALMDTTCRTVYLPTAHANTNTNTNADANVSRNRPNIGTFGVSSGFDSDDENCGGDQGPSDISNIDQHQDSYDTNTNTHTNTNTGNSISHMKGVSREEYDDLLIGIQTMSMNMQKMQTNISTIANVVRDITITSSHGMKNSNSNSNSGGNSGNDSVQDVIQSLIGELEVLKLASSSAISNRLEEVSRIRHIERRGSTTSGTSASTVTLSPVSAAFMDRNNSVDDLDDCIGNDGISMNPIQKQNQHYQHQHDTTATVKNTSGGSNNVTRRQSAYSEL